MSSGQRAQGAVAGHYLRPCHCRQQSSIACHPLSPARSLSMRINLTSCSSHARWVNHRRGQDVAKRGKGRLALADLQLPEAHDNHHVDDADKNLVTHDH